MTTQRSTFAKLQRERAKKAKAAANREKRQDRGGENDELVLDDDVAVAPTPSVQYNTEDTIRALDDLHQRFEAGTIKYDDFEERKSELLSRLAVE